MSYECNISQQRYSKLKEKASSRRQVKLIENLQIDHAYRHKLANYVINNHELRRKYVVLFCVHNSVRRCVDEDCPECKEPFVIKAKRSISKEHRDQIIFDESGREKICIFCNKNKAMLVEHVWPISFGGCNHDHNLLPACYECNDEKGLKIFHDEPDSMSDILILDWLVSREPRLAEHFSSQIN